MSHSFCIITNGKRRELTAKVIRSIRAQKIPEYEIIVAGIYRQENGVTVVAAEDAALSGRLGALRNAAVERARFENVVMLDDDILLAPEWYRGFLAYGRPFDILTSQIRLPDGGRYYDHATVGGPKGHRFLADDEEDDYVYMTGGGGWVMKERVAKSVQWDAERPFYHEEDVDFSRRCQARGYRISYNPAMRVYHADPTYTTIGRSLRRRKNGRSQEWVLHELDGLSTGRILARALELRRKGEKTEAADVVRMALFQGKGGWLFRMLWRALVLNAGGDLPGTTWSPAAVPEYLGLIRPFGEEDEG